MTTASTDYEYWNMNLLIYVSIKCDIPHNCDISASNITNMIQCRCILQTLLVSFTTVTKCTCMQFKVICICVYGADLYCVTFLCNSKRYFACMYIIKKTERSVGWPAIWVMKHLSGLPFYSNIIKSTTKSMMSLGVYNNLMHDITIISDD